MADPSSSFELLSRLLTHVTIEDDGDPSKHETIVRALARMLESKTARALAERFVAEDESAVVRFQTIDGTRFIEHDGARAIDGFRGLTNRCDDRLIVVINDAYLAASARCQAEDLPATLAHELLGHGLWYVRAARANLFLGIHYHTLNEINARLVGWLVDIELDGRIETGRAAQAHIDDPDGYGNDLRFSLPYYAMTFSSAEMLRPAVTLEARLAGARERRGAVEKQIANHRTWYAVINHFVAKHGLDESRLRDLRAEMAETDKSLTGKLAQADAVAAEIVAMLERLRAETDQDSEAYLRRAAAHPLIAELAASAAEHDRRLRECVAASPHDPYIGSWEPDPQSADADSDRVTFDDLVAMYRRDLAEHPEHWCP